MLDLEENNRNLLELQDKLKNLFDALQIAKLKKSLNELEQETLKENFWNETQKSSEIYAKMSSIQKKIRTYDNLKNELENLIELNELLLLENDYSLEKDLISNTQKIQKQLEDVEVQTLLSGKYDVNNAILTLHPGAGRNRIPGLG